MFEELTEEQLEITIQAETFQTLGLCIPGSRDYAKLNGVNFKDIVAGKVKVRDAINILNNKPEPDQNIINLINKTLEG